MSKVKYYNECKRNYPDCGSPHVCDICYQLSILKKEKQELVGTIKELKNNIESLNKSIRKNEVTIDEIEYLLDNDYYNLLEKVIQKYEGDNDELEN